MIDAEPIKAAALAAGFDLVGVGDPAPDASEVAFRRRWLDAGFAGEMGYLEAHHPIKSDPERLLAGARSVVMVAAFYGGPVPAPGVARYARGRDYHRVLKRRLRPVAEAIAVAAPGSKSRVMVDSAPTPDRLWAHIAGLGWYGKNSMLINSARGSYFLLGAVLTDALLARDAPAEGGCGSCRRCVEACPTGAIVTLDGRWSVDSRLCVSYRTIEERSDDVRLPTHGWLFGCDVCQEVCPFNSERASQPLRNASGRIPELYESRRWPTADEAATLSDEAWDEMTRGSAARRATARMWRRNARRARLYTRSRSTAVASPPPMQGLATA